MGRQMNGSMSNGGGNVDMMKDLVRAFPFQWGKAMEISQGFTLPHAFRSVSNLIVSGMGGSAMGGDLLRDLLRQDVRGPIIVNRSYDLPGWVGTSSMVCLVSYSGNTEETLSVYRLAKSRRLRMCCITSGGELAQLALRDEVPLIRIPSGYPPRAALGYSFLPLVRVAQILGWGKSLWKDAQETHQRLMEWSMLHDRGESSVLMKRLASAWAGHPVLIVVPEDRRSVGFRWKNQFNENAKTLSYVVTIPEMNHNEIVGWSEPAQSSLKRWSMVSLRDVKDHPRIAKRFEITKQLWKKSKGREVEIWSEGRSFMSRFMFHVYFGDWMSVYLAERHHVQASPVPSIDWLKKQMASK